MFFSSEVGEEGGRQHPPKRENVSFRLCVRALVCQVVSELTNIHDMGPYALPHATAGIFFYPGGGI